MPLQHPPLRRGRAAVVPLTFAALMAGVVSCSSDGGEGPGGAQVSGAPPTSAPIFARQLEDPIDDRVNPTAPSPSATSQTPSAPILHVLGSISSVTEASPAWQTQVPVVLDDVATIATLACDPTSDTCSAAAFTSWALGGIELVNVATEEVANSSGNLDASISEIRSTGIEVIGYGPNQAAAVAGITIKRADVTVSLHAISLNADATRAASASAPGIVGPDAFGDLLTEVSTRRQAGDAVIVLVDVGAADDRAPTASQVEQIQRLVELDVDAVIGGGSDFLQRFDRVANSSVAYNLGQAMTETSEPLRADSAVLRLEFGAPGRACLLPSTATAAGPSLDEQSITECGQ